MKHYKKQIHIFGGGTLSHVATHFAICAPAYGKTAQQLKALCDERFHDMDSILHLTKMAGGSLETNEDVLDLIMKLKADSRTRVVFMNAAMVDYNAVGTDAAIDFKIGGKFGRFSTTMGDSFNLKLKPSEKIISKIREGRKDIFLVAFKTTHGASKQEMYEKGLTLCKTSSCNLVLVNDVKTRWNMIITPEEAAYSETQDRLSALKELVDMTYFRSHLSFTRSTVVDGSPVPWSDPRVPESLRKAVEFCIRERAYKPFNGATVGHFAVRLSETEFLTSIRKSDFNKLPENGLVYVKTDGPDTVLAYGAKPSVGGQSQRIIFNDHKGYDCVLHFHSPLRKGHSHDIPVVSQREVECGSHQCGRNTSNGLAQFGNLKAVMLDNHGPNIIFPSSIDPIEVIEFVRSNFDLEDKTGGYNL